MQFLRLWYRWSLIVLAAAMLTLPATMQANGHPPEVPDHGLNESEFWVLWAGDSDDGNISSNGTGEHEYAVLAGGTDIPLDTPPKTAETWNEADLDDVPDSDHRTAIHPPGVERSDGAYIRDAGIAVAAIQPSTRTHLTPSEAPLFVASSGEVLGTIDYRIALPGNDTVGDNRTRWALVDHRIENVTLAVDGESVTTEPGTKTPTLSYSGLGRADGSHTLELSATIRATLEQQIRIRHVNCTRNQTEDGNHSNSRNETTGTNETAALTQTVEPTRTEGENTSDGINRTCESHWRERTTEVGETVTVNDSQTVTAYSLSPRGFRTRFPNGDLGLAITTDHPWLGYELPTGEVRGVWRFYVARDEQWDRVEVRSTNGTINRHSPFHPVQVHAYPSSIGPTAIPSDLIEHLETEGPQRPSPSLPDDVHLDVATESYVATHGLATRSSVGEGEVAVPTVYGLVRGVEAADSSLSMRTVDVRKSNLTLERLDRTSDATTVLIRLRTAHTGDPIDTRDRSGYVGIDDERVNTTGDGTAVVTVAATAGAVNARYVPGRWWIDRPGYVGDSDVVYVGGTVLQYVRVLFTGLLPVAILVVAGGIIQGVTGWDLWPPWRGL